MVYNNYDPKGQTVNKEYVIKSVIFNLLLPPEGSSVTRPTPARVVQQSLATGRAISHQVVDSGVAL